MELQCQLLEYWNFLGLCSYLFGISKVDSLNPMQLLDLQHSKVESLDLLTNASRELQNLKNGLAGPTTCTNLGREFLGSFQIFNTLNGMPSKTLNPGRVLPGTFPQVQTQGTLLGFTIENCFTTTA